MDLKFIRVTKDNASHDRGFIAVDAICSAFENKETKNVSIMTMDGFWYDVVDDIEKLWTLVSGRSLNNGRSDAPKSKQDYLRRKRMLASPCVEKLPKREDASPTLKDGVEIIGRPPTSKYAKEKKMQFINDLPTGVGEGQHEIDGSHVDVFQPSSDDSAVK